MRVNTYWDTGTYGNHDQSHDVCVHVEDAACSADEGDHSKGQHSDPENGHEEAHQEPFPVKQPQHYIGSQGSHKNTAI